MAYIDRNLEFSDAQAVTATAISANQYDSFTSGAASGTSIIPNTRLDHGVGEDAPWLVVTTNTAATDTGSDATLTITLESADDSAGTTNATVHFSTGALPFATFSPQGATLVRVRMPSAPYRRWIYVRYTVANGPLTAGAFDAYLSTDAQANRGYRSGYTA